MTKISKKILIGALVILMALAVVVMPFMYLKKTGKVYAESESWTRTFNSERVSTQMVRALSSGYPSSYDWSKSTESLITSPVLSHNANNNTLSVSFADSYYLYYINNAVNGANLNTYNMTTTATLSQLVFDYTFPNGGSVSMPDLYSNVQSLRLSDVNTANLGFMVSVYLQQHTPNLVNGIVEPVTWFDYSKLYSIGYSFGTHFGIRSTFMVKYTCLGEQAMIYNANTSTYTPSGEFSTLSLCLLFYIPENTYYTNFYNKFTGNRTSEIVGYEDTYYYNGVASSSSLQEINDSYNSGYTTGYAEGENDGYDVGYDAGDTAGYTRGYNTGDSAGYTRGLTDANNYTFINLIGATVDAPVKALTGLLNFEILGVNLSAFVYGLFSITLVIIIIRYIKGGK